jgi:NAD(P)-dependent dehydrogenase (short-subunit alcohol dehydrogenase family)
MENLSINSMFSVKGKTALVTGGSAGIGRMIAEGFVKNGAKVYISSRKADVCDQVAKELTEHGPGECIAAPADLSSEEEAKRLAGEISGRESCLHILVNNAGMAWGAPLEEHGEKAWEKVLSLNVKGVFHLIRELAPLLKKAASDNDPARVINIGSIDGLHVAPLDTFSYGASKAALHHLTRILGKKMGPDGITVNVIAPGYVHTNMTDWLVTSRGDEFRAKCPLGRLGETEDMAGVALFLASKAGAYINGEIIRVDGGTIL